MEVLVGLRRGRVGARESFFRSAIDLPFFFCCFILLSFYSRYVLGFVIIIFDGNEMTFLAMESSRGIPHSTLLSFT